MTPNRPRNFDFVVPFDPPFTYDPSRGNLLVDFLAPENWDVLGQPQIDAHINFTPGGPITLIGSFDTTADTTALDLAAPALWSTQFTFISLPPGLIDNPGLDNPGLDGRLPPGQRDGLPRQSRHARPVPEPASVTLFLLGCCIGCLARRYSLRS